MHRVTATLTSHYESCLAEHGPTARGMDWGPDASRLALRFDAICRAMEFDRAGSPVTLLDVGCGCGLLLDHLDLVHPGRVHYSGLDASPRMIEAARQRRPGREWIVGDVLDGGAPVADWVVANGVLTERRETSESEMTAYAEQVVTAMFRLCRRGIVFNVLTSHVNYRNPMLHYWDPGAVIAFASRSLSRHVALWQDLAIYDLFCCVRREPWTAAPPRRHAEESDRG